MEKTILNIQAGLPRPLLQPALQNQNQSVVMKAVNIILQLSSLYRISMDVRIHSIDLFYRFIEIDLLSYQKNSDCLLFPEIYAIACFLVTVKFHEIHCPTLHDLSKITNFQCKVEDIQSAEENILVAVQWDLNTTTGI